MLIMTYKTQGTDGKYVVILPVDAKVLDIEVNYDKTLTIVFCTNMTLEEVKDEKSSKTLPVYINILQGADELHEDFRYYLGTFVVQRIGLRIQLVSTHNLFPSNSVDLFARTTISK